MQAPDEQTKYLRDLRCIAETEHGRRTLAYLLKKFRLYKLSSGGTPEITARREGVRSCALLLFEDLREAAPTELEQIIGKTLKY